MTTYRIISNNTSLGVPGDTINDEDLAGLSVPALVEGGFIEPIAVKPQPKSTNKQTEKE
jgi:hypothetical protein